MNDARITDYALNELQAEEREKFESDLAADQSLQTELHASSRVADGLAQIMSEPGEGLEPQARAKLLRAIAENQEAFRKRRKIARFALPVSLAAAASIAVLLWVTGGTTTQQPPEVAAANRGLSGGFVAKISSNKDSFTFRGNGQLSGPSNTVQVTAQSEDSAQPTTPFRVSGIRTTYLNGAAGRTISMSESGRAALEMRADAGLSLSSPAVRMKPLIWDDELPRWSGFNEGQP
jgi:anti-sigma factor RsiW